MDPNFSIEFFKWKHLNSPFGRSFGLIALHNKRIVGLRMFMFWEFYSSGLDKFIRAIRPVDTVTDANYRGKGIFKKLNLIGLDRCKGNYDLVFNTPNENSLPANLKMGWKKLENVENFKIGIIHPFLKNYTSRMVSFDEVDYSFQKEKVNWATTVRTREFLSWRYKDESYKIAGFRDPRNFIIYKEEKRKGLPAIIAYEIIGDPTLFSCMMSSLGRSLKTPLVYFYNSPEFREVEFLACIKRKKSIVLYRNDRFNFNMRIELSLADLEGVL
ncbi:hypothetical protein [Salinimicrobium terrae]|uniref:hypothetical protein n=1 Tax=Salinimicrobium terrae TaxID=470866 RepID=UPI001FE00140|nr:hypothetical protein [Salinimicrobium terrae]